jgi:hypothetical protein
VRPYAQGLRQVTADVRWRQQRESTVKITVLTGLTGTSSPLGPDESGQVFSRLGPLLEPT